MYAEVRIGDSVIMMSEAGGEFKPMTEDKFKTFTPKEICDATKSTEVLVCLSSQSREEVDEMVRKAVAAGGTTYNEPQDYGFMYGHGFEDLDGHIWEIMYMEPSAIN